MGTSRLIAFNKALEELRIKIKERDDERKAT